jgi:hypothetical protein
MCGAEMKNRLSDLHFHARRYAKRVYSRSSWPMRFLWAYIQQHCHSTISPRGHSHCQKHIDNFCTSISSLPLVSSCLFSLLMCLRLKVTSPQSSPPPHISRDTAKLSKWIMLLSPRQGIDQFFGSHHPRCIRSADYRRRSCRSADHVVLIGILLWIAIEIDGFRVPHGTKVDCVDTV